jgi:hypothetical protein
LLKLIINFRYAVQDLNRLPNTLSLLKDYRLPDTQLKLIIDFQKHCSSEAAENSRYQLKLINRYPAQVHIKDS